MSLIYADDLMPDAVFKLLQDNTSSYLIDVRTKAETIFVGVPAIQDRYCLIEWQLFPSMKINDSFIEELSTQLDKWQSQDGIEKQDRDLYFLCRSGVRSASAADAATKLGCSKSYNIAGGFEGDVDKNGHRAHLSGWKFTGLPWTQ